MACKFHKLSPAIIPINAMMVAKHSPSFTPSFMSVGISISSEYPGIQAAAALPASGAGTNLSDDLTPRSDIFEVVTDFY